MAPDFDIAIRHWPTLAEFVAHLATVPRPVWCRRVTNHNTYIPNERQWVGMRSMNSMQAEYIKKGWTAGPHLYLAAECPNPADRGIWQMTPLALPGIHAGPCNVDALGVEWVGDFQARPPSVLQYDLGLAVNEAICRAWGLTAADIVTHKECMPGRTCPGQYFPASRLRADVQAQLASDEWAAWGTRYPLPVEQRAWGIPQFWRQNRGVLGEARSFEIFPDPVTSIQTFQGGMVVYEKLADRALLLRRAKRLG